MERPSNARRPPPALTRDRLEKAALDYVARYASSAGNLRRVLMRRVERAARRDGCDRTEAAAWVAALVARHVASGVVDDKAFAEAATASLRRRGASARHIRMKLAAKGVDRDTASAAMDAAGGSDPAVEQAAALAFARRRRLGPFGPAATRRERRNRDLASLARAGFDLDIARRVIDAAERDGDR